MQDTRGISLECHIKQQHVDGFSSGVIGVSMSEPHTSVFNYDSLYNLCAQKGCLGHGIWCGMSSTRCVVHFVVYGEWVVLWVAVTGKGGGREKGEGRKKER